MGTVHGNKPAFNDATVVDKVNSTTVKATAMGRPRKIPGPGRILSTKIPVAYWNQFDKAAERLGFTKSELLGYIVKTVVDQRGWVEDLEALEKEKKQRLIRYIM